MEYAAATAIVNPIPRTPLGSPNYTPWDPYTALTSNMRPWVLLRNQEPQDTDRQHKQKNANDVNNEPKAV